MEPAGQADLLAAARSAAGPVPGAPSSQSGPGGERFGIYVHCPYCRTKCPYCDFNVAIHREDRIAPFVAALRAELARYAALPWAGRVPGGEPVPRRRHALAAAARGGRGGAGRRAARPRARAGRRGDARGESRGARRGPTPRLPRGRRDAALARRPVASTTRCSGASAATHSAADAGRAYRAARAAGFDDVSLDLLYACPGQDLAGWRAPSTRRSPGRPSTSRPTRSRSSPPRRSAAARPPACRTRTSWSPSSRRCSSARRARVSSATRSRTSRGRAGAPATTSATGTARDYLGLGPGAHGALGAVRYWTQRSEPRWRTAVHARDAGRSRAGSG